MATCNPASQRTVIEIDVHTHVAHVLEKPSLEARRGQTVYVNDGLQTTMPNNNRRVGPHNGLAGLPLIVGDKRTPLCFMGMSVADHTGICSAWANGRGFLYMLAQFVKIKTAAVSHPETFPCCSG